MSLLGGHTVQDQEIKFGYAITGAIDPARMLSNAGAKAGDVLFLTKPLGTGIVGTAIKFDRVEPALADEAVRSMRTLNRAAAEALQSLPAGRRPCVHRRHRLRPDRARDRDGAGRAASRSRSTRARCRSSMASLAIAERQPVGRPRLQPRSLRAAVSGCRRVSTPIAKRCCTIRKPRAGC